MSARMCLAFSGTALVGIALALAVPALHSQTPPPPTPPAQAETLPPPGANVVAAKVNGQVISELSVYRGLMRLPPNLPPLEREAARKKWLDLIIDNMLIDQYLTQLKIQIEGKEVDERIVQIKGEAKKAGQDFGEM